MTGYDPNAPIPNVQDLRDFDPEFFFTSGSVQYCKCQGGCSNLHLVLIDLQGTPFAQAVMNVDMLERALAVAKRLRDELQ